MGIPKRVERKNVALLCRLLVPLDGLLLVALDADAILVTESVHLVSVFERE